ncbi:MAG: uroporphyrinogen-III C-methyltransferase [Methylococcaceae bacterium]
MAELSEQQAQEPNETIVVRKSHGGLWFGVIILLVVVSMGGIGFYLFQQLRSQQDSLGGEVNKEDLQLTELRTQISSYQSQIAALSAEMSAKDNRVTQSLAEFSRTHNEKVDNTRKELTESLQQLQRQLGKTRGDWLLADAEYLLSVANERLHLVGDVNTTREALEAADQRLRESGDAGAFKIREEIAKEISALKNITAPDIVGLYSKIQSLEESVNNLELLLPYAGKPLTPASEVQSSDEDGVLSSLKGIVTVRHIDKTVKEILTPEEAQFIRQQLRVKLELIKVALVQHNDALFQSGIKDAQSWLEANFAKTTSVSAMQSDLIQLGTIKIHSQFPDISLSLKMLKDISKLRIESDKGAATNEGTKTIELTKPVVSFDMPKVKPAEIIKPAVVAPKAAETVPPVHPEAE